jgi:hypothetical protein
MLSSAEYPTETHKECGECQWFIWDDVRNCCAACDSTIYVEVETTKHPENPDRRYWWEYFRAMRAENRDMNTAVLEDVCNALSLGVHRHTPYHWTLSKSGFPDLDVFPTSGKTRVRGTNKFKTPNVLAESVAHHFGAM